MTDNLKQAADQCTAKVYDNRGRITTESCKTKRPLIDMGGCLEGCCDDYKCPDCGHEFRVSYGD